jgi:hypothetical protein
MKSLLQPVFAFVLIIAIVLPSVECQAPDNATLMKEAEEWLGQFNWLDWKEQADTIRRTPGLRACLFELSFILENNTTTLMQTQYSAAAGLMALLPTIGALVAGQPTKNLWIMYKLLPMCGVLALMQSLGGQLLPESLDREKEVGGLGFADTHSEWALLMDRPSERRLHREVIDLGWSDAIDRVTSRTYYPPENPRFMWRGLLIMIFCQLSMFIVMYLGQAGGIIAWWCTCWGWMFFWYLMVTTGSFLDSWANSPYPRVWKIKATILSNFHHADSRSELEREVQSEIHRLIKGPAQTYRRLKPRNRNHGKESLPLTSYNKGTTTQASSPINLGHGSHDVLMETVPLTSPNVYATTSEYTLPKSDDFLPPDTISDHFPFCILITRRGMSTRKRFFRLLMRIVNSGIFIIATGLFSSVVLMSLNMATAITCCLAAAGIIGRIAAMWLVHYTVLGDSCVHFPVRTDEQAIELLGRIVKVPGLKLELGNVVFCEGRIAARGWRARFKWLIFGLLVR